MSKLGQPKEGTRWPPCNPRCSRCGMGHARQGVLDTRTLRTASFTCLHLSLPEHSQDWAGLSHWKSQPGFWRLGKGRALKINHSAQPESCGREPGEQALPPDTPSKRWLDCPSRGAPLSGSWPLGWAAGRWQPGIFDPQLLGAPPPPHTHAHSHPCTPHLPQPGVYSTDHGWDCLLRKGVPGTGTWDTGVISAAATSLSTGKGVSPHAPKSLLP